MKHVANSNSSLPLLGAQVWIEPGQTPQEIDAWFRTLAEYNAPVARMFLMWNYLEPRPEAWDFRLYDLAFDAAEKYNIRIIATLTAHHGPPHRGFWYRSQGASIIEDEAQLEPAEVYIKKVVERYKNHPALDTWMLMNEPGQAPAPHPLAMQRYRKWLKKKYESIEQLNALWLTDFKEFEEIEYDERWFGEGFISPTVFVDWYVFWREHLRWHLKWVADKVRQSDPIHPIHVNPYDLLSNLTARSYDLPSWRKFIDSLGASIHPAWHFQLLRREQFALGVAYACDLIRGSSEPHPFWVTELQGGNNIYSSTRPLCPSEKDIAQWVWTAIGSGAERVIFWLLNARKKGYEAGEWSLLDFQNRASERLHTAGQIGKTIRENQAFFNNAKPIKTPITILLSLETMTLQERYNKSDYPGRYAHAHILSALAFYETFQQMGISAQVKHVHDFQWQKGARPRLIILPHMTALTAEQAGRIEEFVRNGNTALITGLTGFYDAEGKCWPLDKFPLQSLLGATLKEVRLIEEESYVHLTDPQLILPAHLWIGEIDNHSAEIIGERHERISAVRRTAGDGTVIWIPSTIGLGAWMVDEKGLAELLESVAEPFVGALPVRFKAFSRGCLMRTLKTKDALLTVIVNGTDKPSRCVLVMNGRRRPRLLWGSRSRVTSDVLEVILDARETVVLLWE